MKDAPQREQGRGRCRFGRWRHERPAAARQVVRECATTGEGGGRRGESGGSGGECTEDSDCVRSTRCYSASCEAGILRGSPLERGSACADEFCNGFGRCLPCLDDAPSVERDTGCSRGSPICTETDSEPECGVARGIPTATTASSAPSIAVRTWSVKTLPCPWVTPAPAECAMGRRMRTAASPALTMRVPAWTRDAQRTCRGATRARLPRRARVASYRSIATTRRNARTTL